MSHPHSHGHSHHNHGHPHGGGSQNRRALATALAITATYTVAEVIGGLITGSLALLADAGHMLSDNFSLGLALFAFWLSAKPSHPRAELRLQAGRDPSGAGKRDDIGGDLYLDLLRGLPQVSGPA